MDHLRFVVNFLAIWLVLQTSAMMISDKWDAETLNKQLHDSSKERIDLDCDACKILVDMIQFLARLNSSEDEIAAALAKYCIDRKLEDNLVCTQVVQEFKVSACGKTNCVIMDHLLL